MLISKSVHLLRIRTVQLAANTGLVEYTKFTNLLDVQ